MNIRSIATILIVAILIICAIVLITGTGTLSGTDSKTASGNTPGETSGTGLEGVSGSTSGSNNNMPGNVLQSGNTGMQEPQILPASYDLRDVNGKCYITPVKTQTGTLPDGQPDTSKAVGTCWAFSACAALESSLLKQGIVSGPDSPAANLSVWHMGNWNGYNHPVYIYNNAYMPNSTLSIGYTETEPVIRGWGGDHRYATDYLISGKGPVLNHYAPFPLDDMQEKKELTKPPEKLPVSYMLRETVDLSRPEYATDGDFRKAVKEAVIKYGALVSFMYTHPSIYPGFEETPIFNRTSGDYYFNGTGDGILPASLNHAVTITGWDDNRVIPGASEPGAWLIKNSAGTNFGNDGYIWISYADEMFLKGYCMAVAFIADSGEGYDTTHHYETHAGALSDTATEPYEISWDYLSDGFAAENKDSWACARFTAEEDADLGAVGFMTLNKNETVMIDVYGGWDESDNQPDTDRLLLSDNTEIPEKGYHLIDLSRQVSLKKGEEFIIALGFKAKGDTAEITEPLVYVTDDAPQTGKTFRLTPGIVNEKDRWEDYAGLHNGSIFYVQGFMASPD